MKKILVSLTFGLIAQANTLYAQAEKTRLGFLDVEAIWGINFTKPQQNFAVEGEVGTDYDLGVTFLSVPLSKNDPSPVTTVALHYAYTRQNFSGYQLINDIKFRRNEVFARIKPFTFNPAYPMEYSKVFGLVLGGLYADVGYTSGNYFFENVNGNITPPTDNKSGLVWGWGYNANIKKGRFGGIVGFGSKRYNFASNNGSTIKYKSRSFQFGISYALNWQEKNR